MKEKELDKFLEKKLGKEVIDALDERYVMTRDIDPEECETNPIIAKKQKIADFYKSLDDDEKLLLGTICEVPTTIAERDKVISLCSGNPCKDYAELLRIRLENLINKFPRSGIEIPAIHDVNPFFVSMFAK